MSTWFWRGLHFTRGRCVFDCVTRQLYRMRLSRFRLSQMSRAPVVTVIFKGKMAFKGLGAVSVSAARQRLEAGAAKVPQGRRGASGEVSFSRSRVKVLHLMGASPRVRGPSPMIKHQWSLVTEAPFVWPMGCLIAHAEPNYHSVTGEDRLWHGGCHSCAALLPRKLVLQLQQLLERMNLP